MDAEILVLNHISQSREITGGPAAAASKVVMEHAKETVVVETDIFEMTIRRSQVSDLAMRVIHRSSQTETSDPVEAVRGNLITAVLHCLYSRSNESAQSWSKVRELVVSAMPDFQGKSFNETLAELHSANPFHEAPACWKALKKTCAEHPGSLQKAVGLLLEDLNQADNVELDAYTDTGRLNSWEAAALRFGAARHGMFFVEDVNEDNIEGLLAERVFACFRVANYIIELIPAFDIAYENRATLGGAEKTSDTRVSVLTSRMRVLFSGWSEVHIAYDNLLMNIEKNDSVRLFFAEEIESGFREARAAVEELHQGILLYEDHVNDLAPLVARGSRKNSFESVPAILQIPVRISGTVDKAPSWVDGQVLK